MKFLLPGKIKFGVNDGGEGVGLGNVFQGERLGWEAAARGRYFRVNAAARISSSHGESFSALVCPS